MRKKIMLVCLALAALAVAPATASAVNDPEVTSPTGTLAAVGSQFLGTNVGETVATDANGNILTRCTTAKMTGTLTKNDGTNVEGNITSVSLTGTGPEGKCTSAFGNIRYTFSPATNGLPWCIKSTFAMTTDEVQIRGDECTKAARPIRVILHSDTVGECIYERTTAIAATFATDTGGQDATLTASKQSINKVGGGIFCPSQSFYDLTMTLEKDTTESADPLYFS